MWAWLKRLFRRRAAYEVRRLPVGMERKEKVSSMMVRRLWVTWIFRRRNMNLGEKLRWIVALDRKMG